MSGQGQVVRQVQGRREGEWQLEEAREWARQCFLLRFLFLGELLREGWRYFGEGLRCSNPWVPKLAKANNTCFVKRTNFVLRPYSTAVWPLDLGYYHCLVESNLLIKPRLSKYGGLLEV